MEEVNYLAKFGIYSVKELAMDPYLATSNSSHVEVFHMIFLYSLLVLFLFIFESFNIYSNESISDSSMHTRERWR